MFVESRTSSRPQASELSRQGVSNSYFPKDMENYQSLKKKNKNGTSAIGVQFAVSPVSPEMIPMGKAQSSARDLLNSILDTIIQIFGKIYANNILLEYDYLIPEFLFLVLGDCNIIRESCDRWGSSRIKVSTAE